MSRLEKYLSMSKTEIMNLWMRPVGEGLLRDLYLSYEFIADKDVYFYFHIRGELIPIYMFSITDKGEYENTNYFNMNHFVRYIVSGNNIREDHALVKGVNDSITKNLLKFISLSKSNRRSTSFIIMNLVAGASTTYVNIHFEPLKGEDSDMYLELEQVKKALNETRDVVQSMYEFLFAKKDFESLSTKDT